MKRVLLTGGTGFIGRHALAPLLACGYEVHGAYWRSAMPEQGPVQWHRYDLLDPTAPARLVEQVAPTHLLHFAWYAVPGKYWTSTQNVLWVEASLRLLRAFADSGGRRAVLAGTCAEYDWSYGFCSEEVTPLRPSTLYGVSKHALQQLAFAFGAQAEVRTAWGRIFFVYGPGEHPGRLVSSVIGALLRGEAAPCSHGNQIRDFLHVEDVASAFVSLLDSDVDGEVNIASGSPVALRDVLSIVGEELGQRDLVRFGELPTPADDVPLLVADVRRLRDEVGWQPIRPLGVGLRETIDWWRSRLVAHGEA